jgi:Zn-dependent M28 family amino/carboxypeptidase
MNRQHAVRRAAVAAVALLSLMGCRDHAVTATNADEPPKPAAAAPAATAFDAARAFEHVRRQVAFGPRPAGSPALAETRKYIEGELKSYGLTVREEPFTAATPTGKVDMVNVVAELPGALPDVLLLTSHYDTKRLKDFVGANDGGSSTGALLEIARVLADGAKTKKPDLTIDFVFFDGEEAVIEWTDTDSTYGSRHYVEAHKADGSLSKVRAMVLLDMIGDRDLNVHRELNSTRSLADVIWQTAASLGYAKQFPNTGYYIEDDHMPFLAAGVPSVDLIDFQYGTDQNYGPGGPANAYWHSPADTLDKLSPESLKAIGDTIVASVPKLMTALKR